MTAEQGDEHGKLAPAQQPAPLSFPSSAPAGAKFAPTFEESRRYFESRLKRSLPARRSVSALCPFHQDRQPSLSLNLEKGVFHCHGCGAQGGILDFERRMMGTDTVTAWAEIFRICGKQPPAVGRKLVKAYDYVDVQGKLLYQKLRYEPKSFAQRQPDGKGGWHYNLHTVKRVLYRLPEVITAKLVFIVEGEKDADNLRDALADAAIKNCAVTTTFDGAGHWKPEYAPYFTGRLVVVLADNDGNGKAHQQTVCASLVPYAAKVKALDLPGLPEKGDVSDWLEAGTEAQRAKELMSLVKAAPLWAAPDPGTKTADGSPVSGFKLLKLSELLSRPEVPPDYLVDGLLIRGTVSVVVAKPKVGKSTLARGLCLAVARGDPFLGRATGYGAACIYLALEERYEEITADFRAMGARSDDPITVHADAAPVEAILELIELVRKQRPALVVIDPLFRLARIRDEKAYAEVYAALGPLIDVARETGTHILLTHHAGKSAKADPIDSPLGSTAIGGAAATTIVLSRRESYRTVQTVTRIGPVLPETVLSFDPETRLLAAGGTKAEADCQEIEKAMVEYLEAGGEQTEPEIVGHVEGANAVKRKALRSLVEKGLAERVGTGKRGDPFRYSYARTEGVSRTTVQEIEELAQSLVSIGEDVVLDSGNLHGEHIDLEGVWL